MQHQESEEECQPSSRQRMQREAEQIERGTRDHALQKTLVRPQHGHVHDARHEVHGRLFQPGAGCRREQTTARTCDSPALDHTEGETDHRGEQQRIEEQFTRREERRGHTANVAARRRRRALTSATTSAAPASTAFRRDRARRQKSVNGAAAKKSVTAPIAKTTARVRARQPSRATAMSAGLMRASTSNWPPREGMMNECSFDAGRGLRLVCKSTGTSEPENTKRLAPGASLGSPSSCSATTVPIRADPG